MGENKKNQEKNKLILFLSNYRNGAGTFSYKSKYGKIEGAQTPDAPTKYFFKHLFEEGKKLDSILCITSLEANGGKDGEENEENKNAYKHYKNMLEDFYVKENIKKEDRPKLERINFDYNFEKDNKIEEFDKYKELFKNIENHCDIEKEPNTTIYIDYTSGIRDTSLIIILIIRYLQYTGIKCGGMIYSYYNKDDEYKNKIIDIKSTYDLFELLNGVNEFTSFGKSKTLSNYYKNIWKNKEENREIRELIDVMNDFSDLMSLCMVEDIDEIMNNLNEKITKVKKIKNKDDKENNENKLMNYMFFNLINEIENKFYLKGENQITYINLIKWCLDNDLIQQALTLYVEKIPEYYNQCGFFNKEDESLLEAFNVYKNDLPGFFYTEVFGNIKEKYGNNERVQQHNNNNNFSIENKVQKLKNIIKLNRDNILSRKTKYLRIYEIEIQEAIKEIYNIMDEKYKQNKVNVKVKNKKYLSEFSDNIPRNEEKFINWLDQQNKLLSYLLNIQNENKLNVKKNKFNENKDKTYDKKIKSLKKLKEKNICLTWFNIESKDLIQLMQDYLYFKIMRNQTNHAKKSDLSEEVKDYFKEINYNMKISVKDIKNIMNKSVENIENIKQTTENKEVAITL